MAKLDQIKTFHPEVLLDLSVATSQQQRDLRTDIRRLSAPFREKLECEMPQAAKVLHTSTERLEARHPSYDGSATKTGICRPARSWYSS